MVVVIDNSPVRFSLGILKDGRVKRTVDCYHFGNRDSLIVRVDYCPVTYYVHIMCYDPGQFTLYIRRGQKVVVPGKLYSKTVGIKGLLVEHIPEIKDWSWVEDYTLEQLHNIWLAEKV
jgi:hypothetical protein